MGELLRIEPELHWPKLTVFESGDTFNKMRGRFYFRDVCGRLQGPFLSKLTAALALLKSNPTSGAPLRTPFEHDGVWWWKKDTKTGVEIAGPYEFQVEADFAVRRYVQELRDEANNEYR